MSERESRVAETLDVLAPYECRVLLAVAREPGLKTAVLSRRTGLGDRLVRHALRPLRSLDLVSSCEGQHFPIVDLAPHAEVLAAISSRPRDRYASIDRDAYDTLHPDDHPDGASQKADGASQKADGSSHDLRVFRRIPEYVQLASLRSHALNLNNLKASGESEAKERLGTYHPDDHPDGASHHPDGSSHELAALRAVVEAQGKVISELQARVAALESRSLPDAPPKAPPSPAAAPTTAAWTPGPGTEELVTLGRVEALLRDAGRRNGAVVSDLERAQRVPYGRVRAAAASVLLKVARGKRVADGAALFWSLARAGPGELLEEGSDGNWQEVDAACETARRGLTPDGAPARASPAAAERVDPEKLRIAREREAERMRRQEEAIRREREAWSRELSFAAS